MPTANRTHRQEFLRQDEVGFLEQFVGDATNSSGVFTLWTPREKDPSGILTTRGRRVVHCFREVGALCQHDGSAASQPDSG